MNTLPASRPMPATVPPATPPSIPATTLPAWERIMSGPKSKGAPRHVAAKIKQIKRFA